MNETPPATSPADRLAALLASRGVNFRRLLKPLEPLSAEEIPGALAELAAHDDASAGRRPLDLVRQLLDHSPPEAGVTTALIEMLRRDPDRYGPFFIGSLERLVERLPDPLPAGLPAWLWSQGARQMEAWHASAWLALTVLLPRLGLAERSEWLGRLHHRRSTIGGEALAHRLAAQPWVLEHPEVGPWLRGRLPLSWDLTARLVVATLREGNDETALAAIERCVKDSDPEGQQLVVALAESGLLPVIPRPRLARLLAAAGPMARTELARHLGQIAPARPVPAR